MYYLNVFKMKFLFLTVFFAVYSNSFAQNPEWKTIKPSTTGIPGEQVNFAKFDPQYNLWVSARWPFWTEGGISKFDGIKWTTYSNVNSPIPSDWVNGVAFGANGVKWFATRNGLVKFDGTNWTVYNMSNAPFPDNKVNSVKIDRQGKVWIVVRALNTTAHGVLSFDGTNWTVYTQNNGLPGWELTGMNIDSNNNVWVGTWHYGIAKFNGNTWTTYNNSNGFTTGRVTGIAFDINGDVYATASTSGIFRFNGSSWSLYHISKGQDFSTISINRNGVKWVGTYGGNLFKHDNGNWIPYNYGNHLYSIDFDQNDKVWAAGLADVKRLNDDGTFKTYNAYNTAMTSYFINAFAFQQNGDAWFATSMGGVCEFDGTVWNGFNPYNGGSQPWPIQHNSADDIMSDKQGNIWVASNGVGKWDGTGWTVFRTSNSNIPDDFVTALAQDSTNRIWMGTDGYGAAHYNGTVWTRRAFGGSYTSNTINAISVDRNGLVWFGTDYGLFKLNGNTLTSYFSGNSGLPDNTVNGISFDQNNNVWIATAEGVAKFTGTQWTVYKETSGIPADYVSSVDVGPTGDVWIAAHNTQLSPYYGGIARLSGSTWQKWTPNNSPLTHYQVEKIKFDRIGNLWISPYSEGAMMFKPGGIITESGNNEVSIIPKNFNLEQNYPNPFNPTTIIKYSLPLTGIVKLSIVDITGKVIKVLVNELKNAGTYSAEFSGNDIASGIYFYRLESAQFVATKKMMLLK